MKDDDWAEEIGAACCDCRHFHEEDGKNIGQCRRFPPRDWFEAVNEAIWPRVAGYQACGEFELTPEKRREWEAEKRRRLAGRP